MNNPNNWSTIESDPGVFSAFLRDLGVKELQVEELWELNEDSLASFQPIYGLIFLFKYLPGIDSNPNSIGIDGPFTKTPYFAKQVITNACASQAILSIILNTPNIDIGEELTKFKEFTHDFDSELRGLAISNSERIRNVHNSFARPEPFILDERIATKGDDVFHFVSFIPCGNALWELDGLKSNAIPIANIEPVEENPSDWIAKLLPILQQKMSEHSERGVHFNLMAVCRDKKYDLLGRKSSLELLESTPEVQAEILDINTKLEYLLQRENDRNEENVRRRHNYIPFLVHLLRILAEKGELKNMIEKSRENK